MRDHEPAVCVLCHVTGRVQGVFFRNSTHQQALSLNISGYVKNLPDGRVEILACGEQGQVKALQDWLWRGPKHAEVTAVMCEIVDQSVPGGFVIT